MFQTCYGMLMSGVDRDGFVVYFNHKIPMRKFLEDIDALAATFKSFKLNKGDVVTLYLPSCPQSLAAFYACSKLGLTANIVHPLVPFLQLKENLEKTNSKVLLFYDGLIRDERIFESLRQICVRCSIADYVTFRKPAFCFYSKFLRKRSRFAYAYAQICKNRGKTDAVGEATDIVCYMHSGGTSGEPKIVKLTNGAICGTALSMQKMYRPSVQKGDFNLATLPIFHAYGLCAAMHTPLYLGCSLILMPKFRPEIVKKYFLHYKVTIWSTVPAMIKKMLKSDCLDKTRLKNLDVIWCGGDVLDETTVEQTDKILEKHCPRARLMRGYGLTEVCGVCAVNSFFSSKKGSCGKPMPDVLAEIWDEDGNTLSAGEPGEIAISSPGNMAGYLDANGENTIVCRDGRTWIKTGDLGYVDCDGFLFVVDRIKRSLKIAAVNVFPSQIENCVKQLPFVDEACAVGTRIDGKQFVKVFVTLNTPTAAFEVESRVKEICRKNLIKYSVPRFVEVLPQMPRTAMGKIDFAALSRKADSSRD